MSDRSKKPSELPVAYSASGSDLIIVTSNTSGNGVTKGISLTNLLGNNNVNTSVKFSTPSNSTINAVSGSIFIDSSYLYVAVANNELKRVALQSF